jgi:hypothetical protein
MKRALLPILLMLLAVAVLAALTYWYEQRWGIEGTFPDDHHH